MNIPTPHVRTLGQVEFIALIAMLFATVAISIDAMLPALPNIGHDLAPGRDNVEQLVITTFIFGMGLGTLFTGPISDTLGRKPVILIGGAIYLVGAALCYFAQSLEMLLIARVIQGLGAAGPRTVSLAMVRDLYRGREMARIMSFAMMIFMLAPAVAPLLGEGVMTFANWHAIFLVLMLISCTSMLWLAMRQPETLPVEVRKALSWPNLTASFKELFSHSLVRWSVTIQALTMGVLFANISSIQSIFEKTFDRKDSFTLWFAFIALVSGAASLLNARVVMVMGMRKVAERAYQIGLALTVLHLVLLVSGLMPAWLVFPAFIIWAISLFGMMSLTMGNLNALAMEPVGHIAGFAASVMTAVATVVSAILAAPVGLAFNGTHIPLVTGSTIYIALSLLLMRKLRN